MAPQNTNSSSSVNRNVVTRRVSAWLVAEQEEYATRARAYQATYREKNRKSLKAWEAQRRVDAYIKKFGVADYLAYKKKKDERKRAARDKRRAKEQAVLEHTYPYDGPRAGRLIVD
ncbi:hypothetical protein B0H13DRAFT_2342604 [Mycena leptocephala]|nr:hypothetical protein B0H13DRAFT_2342604 [Mycena leptocephala]